ncbi:hypothetical protein ALC62_06382, partial [Cyphomyrmex costatus]
RRWLDGLSNGGGGVLRALMFPRQETPSPSCTLYLFISDFARRFGPPPKLPADRFARITFFVKYEITYRNFCGGRGGLRHE